MVMTDMLKAVTALGFVEALIFDLPTALGHAEQRANSGLGGREIRQPVGFHYRAIRLVLAIEEYAHGFPAQGIPGIEVVGLPDLHTILPVLEDRVGRPARKAFLGRSE